MAGFFSKKKFTGDRDKIMPVSCNTCGLFRSCMSPKMKEWGEYDIPIMIVGEAPGETEDKRGIPFCGECGRLLRKVFRNLGYEFTDFIITNAVACRPPKNRTPSSKEIQACRPRLFKQIQEYKPELIFLFGNTPLESVIGNYWKKGLQGIQRWRSYIIPLRDLNCFVVPVYHPSFILRDGSGIVEKIWVNDIKKALDFWFENRGKIKINEYEDYRNEEELVQVTKDINKAKRTLNWILEKKPEYLVFDYETNGLKPDAKGHKIYTVSFSWKRNHAVAFPFFNVNIEFLSLFKRIMTDSKIKKIASNMKYEDRWTRVVLKTEIKGWYWDTMLTAHVLDNRTKISSIKFQAFIRYGTPVYDNELHKYLTSETSNDFNKVEKAPLKELLIYNAIDSLLEYKVFEDQKKEMGI